jgi:hypothetical protein
MIILNFAHPLTSTHLVAIGQISGQSVEQMVDVKVQFDQSQPFAEQAQALIESVGLSAQEWQTARLLVNVPSLSVIAALVLSELHGRMGYFPAVLRLRPIVGSAPPQFEVAEILNLHEVRERARTQR